jgi:PhoPQ-activated pathogenicity-related protein
MVIDVLNMPVSVDYHKVAWGDYSIQIEDYVKLGLAQELSTPEGRALVQMVDPYSYRHRLIMPKLIINGTNDEYWPVDAIKNYLDSIPGENYLLYIPNAGHDLDGGEEAIRSLSAFFGRTLNHLPYPQCKWATSQKEGQVLLKVETTPQEMIGAVLWKTSSKDRDFRDEQWEETKIAASAESTLVAGVSLPDHGYVAFFVDLVYKAPGGGECRKSTRMFVADSAGIIE